MENKLARVTEATRKNWRRSGQLLASLAIALYACGCSSFDHAWRRAGRQPVAPASIAGRWEGRWLSEVNAHSGKLRCLISTPANGVCAARFSATYLRVLHFTYTVPLKVQPTETGWRFQGEENLGKLGGGVYRYDGDATVSDFRSSYSSQYDHGIFEMKRPAGED